MRDKMKIHLLLAAVAVMFVVTLALVAYIVWKNNAAKIDPAAVDITGKIVDSGSADEGIDIIGFKSIDVEAGTTEIQSYFINPSDNDVYFIARLYLEDGTLLYESKLIPPGKAIYNIKISKPLERGSYNAIIYYDTYKIDSMEQQNTMEMSIVINAK